MILEVLRSACVHAYLVPSISIGPQEIPFCVHRATNAAIYCTGFFPFGVPTL